MGAFTRQQRPEDQSRAGSFYSLRHRIINLWIDQTERFGLGVGGREEVTRKIKASISRLVCTDFLTLHSPPVSLGTHDWDPTSRLWYSPVMSSVSLFHFTSHSSGQVFPNSPLPSYVQFLFSQLCPRQRTSVILWEKENNQKRRPTPSTKIKS